MRLLVTRPRPDADAQARKLREQGHEPLVAPLLRVEFLDAGVLPLDGVQALIATSRNALRALARNEALEKAKTLPLFAVGPATASMADSLGFARVEEGDGTAAALAPLIAGLCDPGGGALLHLAGERLAADLKGDLESRGFAVRQPRLYRTVPVPSLDSEVRTALADGVLDGVVLMSPFTARTWAELVRAGGLAGPAAELRHFCLSPRVAEALAGLDAAKIDIAAEPREEGLLALIARKAAH